MVNFLQVIDCFQQNSGVSNFYFTQIIVVSTVISVFFLLVFLQLNIFAKVKAFYLWRHSCSEKIVYRMHKVIRRMVK